MPSKAVRIEVSPSRLEVAVVHAGAVKDSRARRFERADWPSALAEALKDLNGPLTEMVAELGCRGAAATVVYLAPGAVAMVTSCPVSAGPANAEQAARLALSNNADFVLDGSPSGTAILLAEKADGTDAAAVPQTHVLATADSELRVAAVAELARVAGLRVDRLVPHDAVALADAVARVTGPGSGAGANAPLRAVLWLGEHSSVLAVGAPGRLVFVRAVSAGLESLVEALTRPIRPRVEGADPVTLTRDQARTLLKSVGVPNAEQEVPGFPMLVGASLLPQLQPILQRFAVELKQSLRFGIAESQRSSVVLTLAGPGSMVPNLLSLLARQAGIPGGDGSVSGGRTSVLECLGAPASGITLLPGNLRSSAMARRLRPALFAGTGLTLALMGVDFGIAMTSLRAESAKLASLRAHHDEAANAAAAREAALAQRTALAALEQRIRLRLGEGCDAGAALSLLSEGTPASVRLTEIILAGAGATPELTLRGYIRTSDTPDPASVLNRYLAALSSIPAVSSARLGATARGPVRGGDAQSFEARLELVGVPILPDLVAAHGPEAR